MSAQTAFPPPVPATDDSLQAHPHAQPPYRPQTVAYRVPTRRARVARIASFRLREISATAIVALGFDAWAWRADYGGYGAALFGMSCVVAIVVAAPARTAWQRALPLAALAALASLRLAYDPGFPTLVLLNIAILAFAVSRRGGSLRGTALARAAVLSVPILRTRLPALARGVSSLVGRSRFSDRKHLLPALVPLGLALLFGGVFALANPVVAQLLGRSFAVVANALMLANPLRIGMFVVAAAAASIVIRPALVRHSTRTLALPREGEASPTLLATARNSLVLLNIVFLGYNALDAMYLWAGSPPPGVTTQTYAHQGSFWLTVALVLVTITLGTLFRGPLAFDPRAQLSRRLSAVWIAQSGVLAVGTFLRLAMHVRTSGLSDLRFIGALGTTLVAIGLALVGLKIRRHLSFRWLVEGQLAAFAGAIALYALVPTHVLSAMYNVPHIMAGQYGPLVHLRAQAVESESAPTLLPLLDHPDIRVRQGVAALLLGETEKLEAEAKGEMRSSYAKVEATEQLHAARERITATLGGVCVANAEATLSRLVSRTVSGDAAPSLESLPAATESPCYEDRSYF